MKRYIRTLAAGLLIAQAVPAGAQDGLSGAYLAARQAGLHADFEEAAKHFGRALQHDPDNLMLMDGALISYIGLADFDSATPVAEHLRSEGYQSQLADIVVLADLAAREEYSAVMEAYEGSLEVGPLVDNLVLAWTHVGLGQMTDALAVFDEVSENTGTRSFGLYHKAMALALVGDYEGADHILSGAAAGPLPATIHGVITHAQVLSQLERQADAVEMIDTVIGPTSDPQIMALRAELEVGQVIPLSLIRNAREGLAEVFFSVAGVLRGEADPAYTLSYSRVAEHLNPAHVPAILLSAALLEELERYELVTATYDRVPRDHPSFYLAEIGRAEALRHSGRPDAAVEALTQLAKSHGQYAQVQSALGDTLRSLERYDEAAAAYDRTLALTDSQDASQWVTYYARGICHEREGRMDAMEADFRRALDLNPGQPYVLNYLGYALVEQQQKLDEALAMIEEAVAARPDDGYITDSLGWVLYRLGRYDEAILHMERAAELMPVDPVVNDHLGDVLWAVGRTREAVFQWKRALSFVDPSEENPEADPDRMRRKLEVGLDLVLEEEGAEPLAVAGGSDGG